MGNGQKNNNNGNKKNNNGKNKNYRNKDGNKKEGGDKYRERRQNNRKALYEKWEKEITITLDTEIPELPKERLSEPNNDELRQKLKDLDKEIKNKKENVVKLKAERETSKEEDRKVREEKQGSLKGLFNQIKEHNEEIEDQKLTTAINGVGVVTAL